MALNLPATSQLSQRPRPFHRPNQPLLPRLLAAAPRLAPQSPLHPPPNSMEHTMNPPTPVSAAAYTIWPSHIANRRLTVLGIKPKPRTLTPIPILIRTVPT